MGKKVQRESECLFCLRKLKRNICSLKSTSCKSSSINEKLMSFISPADYRNVNDSTMFPDPKICTSCFNLINNIHRNAVKIENFTGSQLNFHLGCASAVEGDLTEKWPEVQESYEASSTSSKKVPLTRKRKDCKKAAEEENTATAQNETVTGVRMCLSPQEIKQKAKKVTEVQDSGEETDNYYDADEPTIKDLVKKEHDIQNPSTSSRQVWSVTSKSAKCSTETSKISLKLVKSAADNGRSAAIQVFESDPHLDKLEKSEKIVTRKSSRKKKESTKLSEIECPTDEKKDMKKKLSAEKCQNYSLPETLLPTKSLGKKEKKSEVEKENLSQEKKLPYLCPYTDCGESFPRHQDLKAHVSLHTEDKPFKCEFAGCFKAYRFRNQYTIHKRIHTGERPYKCQHSGCDRAFMRMKSLRLHETSHSTERPFCCDECGKGFKHIRYFKLHKESHRKRLERIIRPPEKNIPCEVCGKMFSARQNVQRHINLVHKGIKPKTPPNQTFVCEVNGCNRIFRWKSCMVRHKALKHRKEDYKHNGKLVKYICEEDGCKEEFNRHSLLREHRTSAHGKVTECGAPKASKECLCLDCGMGVMKIQMNRHKDTYHGLGSIFNKEERGEFVCMTELCGIRFDNADDLKAHIPYHIDNPPHRCLKENCQKTFLLKKTLDIHMMVHDNIKPFGCNVNGCDKSFVTQLCLMRHSRIHNDGLYVCPVETCGDKFRSMNNAGGHLASHRGEAPYACGLCGAVFSTYNIWSRHKKKHTGTKVEKLNKCSKCGKAFASKFDLKRHIPVHSDEKPYTCEICGLGYASKLGYKGHMLSHGEKKYICKIEGCGKSFTVPLTLKRHQAVHEKSTKLCSSCGKILKVSLKKHKCSIPRQNVSEVQVQFQASDQLKNPIFHTTPLDLPCQELQECEQPLQSGPVPQSFQIQYQGQGTIPLPYLQIQQEPIQQQQEEQQQQQQRQQQQQNHISLPFQHEGQLLPVQVNQHLQMSQELGDPAMASVIDAMSGSIGVIGPDDDHISRHSHLMTTPVSTMQMSYIPTNNLRSNYSFPSQHFSTSSISPFTPFSISSIPVTSLSLNPPSNPMASLSSQSSLLPSMPLANNSLPITSIAISSHQNLSTVTPFSTTNLTTTNSIQPQPQSYATVLSKIDSDYY